MAIKFQPIKVESKSLLDKVPIKEGQFILVIDTHELYVDVEVKGKVERILFDGKDLAIDKTLTEAGFAADAKEVGDKIKLVENAWKELNAKNGLGSGAIQQGPFTVYDADGNVFDYYSEESVSKAFGPNSVAFNRAKAYQMSSFAATSGEAGLTKEEFDERFWDASTGQAINGGQGKDDKGNILDNKGRTYETSFSFAVNFAEGGKAKGRGSFTAGWQATALGDYSIAMGRGVIAKQNHEIALGQWNEENTDTNVLLSIGHGDLSTRKTVLKIYRQGLIWSSAAPSVDPNSASSNEYFVRVKDVTGKTLRWFKDDGVQKLNIRPVDVNTAKARTDNLYALTAAVMNQVVQAALIDPKSGSNVADWNDENKAKARATLGAISLTDAQTEAEKQIEKLNIVNGTGVGAIKQRSNAIVNGQYSVAFNNGQAYQSLTFAAGTGRAGFLEDEFNDYYWDEVNQKALNSGKGKDANGKVLDKNGERYEVSRHYGFAIGEGCHAIKPNSFAGGYACRAEGKWAFVYGRNLTAKFDQQVVFGMYNDYETDDSSTLISIGNGGATSRRTTLRISKDGVITSTPKSVFGVGTKGRESWKTNARCVRVADVTGESLQWSYENVEEGSSTRTQRLNIMPATQVIANERTDNVYAITAATLNGAVKSVLTAPTIGTGGKAWTDAEKSAARNTIGALGQSDISSLLKLVNGLNDTQIQALNKFAQSLTVEE
jgi:hypothetical protein